MRKIRLDLAESTETGPVTRRTAVRGIVRRDGHYLIIHSRYGDYKFPGGGRQDGEQLMDTLIREVKEETARMAHFYPDYLKTELVRTEIFTEKELGVLKLLCQGISTKEICERCGITYNSLKFHKKNIYKKLGVKNRQDAERNAPLLEL